MTRREAYFITTMLGVIAVAVSILLDGRDQLKAYRDNKMYCRMDGDCDIVYDGVNLKCITVNNLHKDKYDKETICNHRISYCEKKRCKLP